MTEPRSVLGLDLSLTRTGMASLDLRRRAIVTAAVAPKLRGHRRIRLIRNRVIAAAATHDLVAIEGPSYGSHLPGFHELAGLWWQIRHGLWEIEKPVLLVSPKTRAKYATANGNSPKSFVLQCARELWPALRLKTHDEADALIVGMIGARVAGHPLDETPDKARWTGGLGMKFEIDPS